MHELILASKSPQRIKILQEAGYEFRTFPVEVSEILDKNLNKFDQISDCARQKAVASAFALKSLKTNNNLILSADTLVLFEGQALGKPQNSAAAIKTLQLLSGQTHEVVTGYCLYDLSHDRIKLGHSVSLVKMRTLDSQEILDYVQTGEPLDKAGSYAIQGKASAFVEHFTGDLQNIIGLPLKDIEKVMTENGWIIKRKS